RNVAPPSNAFAPASTNASAARQPSHAKTFPCRDAGAVSDSRMPAPHSEKKLKMSVCVTIKTSLNSLQLPLEVKRAVPKSCGQPPRAARAKSPTAAADAPALPRPQAKPPPVLSRRQSFLQTRRQRQH